MLSSDETKSGGKPNRRKEKPAQAKKKGEQRKRKAAERQEALTDQPKQAPVDQPRDTREETVEPAAFTKEPAAFTETASPLPGPAETSAADASSVPAVAEVDATVSYRTIADAWGNYSRTSLEQARSYFEKLAGVRSLGAAVEVQAEFARQACETFVTESQKIRELQAEMAKQRMRRLEGLMEKMTQSALGTRDS